MTLHFRPANSPQSLPNTASMRQVAFHSAADPSIEELIAQAAQRGDEAVGLLGGTDIQGLIRAEQAAKRHGIKPVFGLQLHLTDQYGLGDSFACRLYAQHEEGKINLFKLISHGLDAANVDSPILSVPRSLVEQKRGGLLLASGFAGSELLHAALFDSNDQTELQARMYDVLEVEPAPLEPDADSLTLDELTVSRAQFEQAHRLLYEIGQRLGKPVIATGSAYPSKPEATGPSGPGGAAPTLRPTDERLEALSYLGVEQAYAATVTNANWLANQIESYALVPGPQLYSPPASTDDDHQLRMHCLEAAASLYGNPLPDTVALRLEQELALIAASGYASSYLIAKETVKQAAAHHRQLRTRGSIGSVFAAYLLGISEVNPLPAHYLCLECGHSEWPDSAAVAGSGFDLPEQTCPHCGHTMTGDGHRIFSESFLGLEGNRLPHIALYAAAEYREQALEEVRERLGPERALWAIRAGASLERGGIVVVPEGMEAECWTPVQTRGSNLRPGWRHAHFSHQILKQSLPTLDILEHHGLTVLERICQTTGVNAAAIPLNDPHVLSLFSSPAALGISAEQIRTTAATYGIPEFGAPEVRRILEITRPATFSDLVQVFGLSHGEGIWDGNGREKIESGEASLAGCIASRDQIILQLMAGGSDRDFAYRFAEAVRKGKPVPDSWLEQLGSYALPSGFAESSQKIRYLMPKAHMVDHVMLAIQSAYFKLYYPREFYYAYFAVHRESLDDDLASLGYKAIRSRLEQNDKQRIDEQQMSGQQMNRQRRMAVLTLEVALEMTARGFDCVPPSASV